MDAGVTETPRVRVDIIEGAPEGTVAAAFGIEEGGAIALPSPDGAIVLRVDAIEAAPEDDAGVAADRERIAQAVSGAEAQDLFAAFARELRAETEVTLNDAAVQAVADQVQ